jgi:hypothetical protein
MLCFGILLYRNPTQKKFIVIGMNLGFLSDKLHLLINRCSKNPYFSGNQI